MIGYLEYMLTHTYLFGVAGVMGLTWGWIAALGEPWKDKGVGMVAGVITWCLIFAPAIGHMEYRDYKRHYLTCDKYEAKKAGYIFHKDRCYKPGDSVNYIRVNEKTKTKQELLDAE